MRDAAPLFVAISLALYTIEIVRTAWLCDDAYITLRTVDNFVAGYGLRWNIVERVQTYTHPLWLTLIAVPYVVTREPYFTPLVVSIAVSLAAMWLFAARLATSRTSMVVGVSALLFSKAFVDFSTSGLENPLTHLLLALFVLAYWRARSSDDASVAVWCVAGLVMLNRLDLGMLVLPAAAAASWGRRWRLVLGAAALGLAPVVAWELFSIIYYGFPFPNSAYAKLATGVSGGALTTQGLVYLLDSFGRDPLTLLAIVAFTAASVTVDAWEQWPLAAGIALYGCYVVRVGGDFMSGRFLTPMLFCAAAMFVHERWRLARTDAAALVAGFVLIAVFATSSPAITSGAGTYVLLSDANAIPSSGIGDERLLYYGYTGLLRWSRSVRLPNNEQVARGRALRASPDVVLSPSIGVMGYFAGPDAHLIDPYGLADPLLARLPALPHWRVGHYERAIPVGYLDSIRTGCNLVADPAIASRYDELKIITQGDLWSRRRWSAIRAVNLGR